MIIRYNEALAGVYIWLVHVRQTYFAETSFTTNYEPLLWFWSGSYVIDSMKRNGVKHHHDQ